MNENSGGEKRDAGLIVSEDPLAEETLEPRCSDGIHRGGDVRCEEGLKAVTPEESLNVFSPVNSGARNPSVDG